MIISVIMRLNTREFDTGEIYLGASPGHPNPVLGFSLHRGSGSDPG